MKVNDIPPCQIYIDKEGGWFHKGAEMVHKEFIKLFYENMGVDAFGRYIINWGGETCYVEVEDTPYVINRVELETNAESEGNNSFLLSLNDDTMEELDPDTLYVGLNNVLYCEVKTGAFPARFLRPAYYQLAEYIEEKEEAYYLFSKGKRHIISIEAGNSP